MDEVQNPNHTPIPLFPKVYVDNFCKEMIKGFVDVYIPYFIVFLNWLNLYLITDIGKQKTQQEQKLTLPSKTF